MGFRLAKEWARLARLPILSLFLEAFYRFVEDDGWAIASHIALSALTSMFPFLIFVTALAAFLGSQNLPEEAVTFLFNTWPAEVAGPLAQEIHNVLTQARGGLLTLSVVLAIYFSSSGVEALRIALNRAYDVKDVRPWYLLRLESIVYVFIGAFGLLTFALLIVLAPLIWEIILRFAPGMAPLQQYVTVLRFSIVTAILLLALVIMHKYLPAGRRHLRDIIVGILLTFVLWIAGGMAFGSYLAEFARNYVTTYAGLASVMIALVFFYMLACIFIYGGELNAAILRHSRRKQAAIAAIMGGEGG
ncbi:YihY/virulence factor BrkB family protein [Beijerinckia indica]|uniref:Ribonuclease BN n=1 Tax=Beijerinckia indica subsp. indica (strain ATCC 9039 / DSM 1715 / NCIMB 8712) TaxID=395963 RepID=B2ID45_BEII9|nr:ribonuclease BN [Beijerinckia indica subsp. indica ATCC 9039]